MHKDCSGTTLTTPSATDYSYTVGSTLQTFALPAFTNSDTYCELTYTVKYADTDTTLPTSAAVIYHDDPTSPDINVNTADNSQEGPYNIKVECNN